MLKINDIDAKILVSEFSISKHNYYDYYYASVYIKFELQGEKGYFQFFLDNSHIENLNYYDNKVYECVPEIDESTINCLEIYDTKNHYSFGDFEKEMFVSLKIIEQDKIGVKVLINEEFIKINFDDIINVQNVKQR